MEIKEASVCYSGGGIYITWGKLNDNRYFFGALDESLTILDSDPNDLIPGTETLGMDDWEWCEKHKSEDLSEKEDLALRIKICEWILAHGSKECDNYDKGEIQAILEGLSAETIPENKGKTETTSDRALINEVLDAVDEWFKEEREVDTPYGSQGTSSGYKIKNIRLLPERVTLDIYMLERSRNENDVPRGMDEASLRYDRETKKVSMV